MRFLPSSKYYKCPQCERAYLQFAFMSLKLDH